MKEIDVKMNAKAFTTDPNDELSTYGLTTCIAIAIHGAYLHNNKLVPFCGLYHWPGFGVEERYFNGSGVLYDFFDNLRKKLTIKTSVTITISGLYFIGGERQQVGEDGELLVTGTEREVDALVNAAQSFDYIEENFQIAPDAIKHHHFITSGAQSLWLKINLSYLAYNQEEYDVEEEEDLDASKSDITTPRSFDI